MQNTNAIKKVVRIVSLFTAAFAMWTVSAMAYQSGDDPSDDIVVCLYSGRSMTANIDPKTDEKLLWLRWETPRAEVLRPIDWDRVASATINGEIISGKLLLDLIKQIRIEMPVQIAGRQFSTEETSGHQ
jgi:hypothetical protein